MTLGHRRAVRVILRSSQNRILLFLSHFEPGSGLNPAWVFPGGGIEAGETESQAAIRELWEETGKIFEENQLGAPIGNLRHEMPDQRIFATGEAHFFELVIQDEFEPDSTGWTQEEHRDTVAHRWWSLDDLLAESPWIEPAGSMDFLTQWLGASPGTPLQN